MADLVAFAHAAMFSLALSTLEAVLQGRHLPEFSGLTLQHLQQHPPQSIAMIKGHLDQTHQNQCSTHWQNITQPEITKDHFPVSDPEATCTHHCYATFMEPMVQIYSDLTSKFIAPSSSGNNYILVIYNYDSNGNHLKHGVQKPFWKHINMDMPDSVLWDFTLNSKA